MNECIEVIFTEEYEPLRVFELSNFLYNLKVLYSWLATSEEFQSYAEKRELEEVISTAKNIAQGISHKEIYPFYYSRGNLFRKDLTNRDIFIARIYKESPLTIWFMGITTFLVVSLIVSGGEMEISLTPPQIKVKMSSLGEGIKKLKKAIRR
ncbi:MAG: hypothetical protein U9M97_04645 [Candidatus Hadarchaeota archaeon]|nr:hypothetical protein [Candidatus Hadarchaeota archaeon]